MKGMTFVQFPFDAITDIDRLDCLPMSLLVRMARHMTRGGYVRMTHKRMAKELPLPERSYYRAMQQLLDAGLIERKGKSEFLVKAFRYGADKGLIDLSTGRKYRLSTIDRSKTRGR